MSLRDNGRVRAASIILLILVFAWLLILTLSYVMGLTEEARLEKARAERLSERLDEQRDESDHALDLLTEAQLDLDLLADRYDDLVVALAALGRDVPDSREVTRSNDDDDDDDEPQPSPQPQPQPPPPTAPPPTNPPPTSPPPTEPDDPEPPPECETVSVLGACLG